MSFGYPAPNVFGGVPSILQAQPIPTTLTGDEYKSGSVVLDRYGPLLKLEAKDVYALGAPALIAPGTSGGGKTVAAVDMIYTNSKACTHLMYMTGSYDSPANQYLRDRVPEIHVKNPDLQIMCDAWKDTLERNTAFVKFTKPDVVERFLHARANNTMSIQSEIGILRQEAEKNAQMFPERSDMEAVIKLKTTNIKLKFIADNFSLGDPTLLPEDQELIKWAQSTRPCPIYIFDDMTEVFSSPPRDLMTIPFPGEGNTIRTREMKGEVALNFLLMNMLTKMRHFGVGGFFVHTLQAFDTELRSQFGAIMFCGKESVEEQCRLRTMSPNDKDLIVQAYAVAEKYPFYKAIYFNNPQNTPHGQTIALFKPTYHRSSEPIGTDTYRLGMQMITDRINQIKNGQVMQSRVLGQQQVIQQTLVNLAKEGNAVENANSQQPHMGILPMSSLPMSFPKAPISGLNSLLM
jgi:hypothetical protein